VQAQDLEPRFLSPAPVGMNFGVLAYGYSHGNVLLDRALPLEGTDAKLHVITPAFARSLSLFGLSGRLTALVPLATGKWSAELDGRDTSTTRMGIGDPLLAIAVNFVGGPALRAAQFGAHRSKLVMGFSFKVRAPLGQYDETKFFNLSSGRWMFSPRLGLAYNLSRFVIEGYLTGWFFTTNNNFWNGNTVAQDPLMSFQLHGTFTFRRGFWGAVSYGHSLGGATTVNGEENDDAQINNRIGITLTVPITRSHAVKGAFTSGVATRAGADFDTFVVAWQYRWGGN
jgi:hypothetical protein